MSDAGKAIETMFKISKGAADIERAAIVAMLRDRILALEKTETYGGFAQDTERAVIGELRDMAGKVEARGKDDGGRHDRGHGWREVVATGKA